jgi:FMNH2-dependent dimethyl sulfone monooxygenase
MNPVFNSNKLKLGIFGANGPGTTSTTLPERFDPTWSNAIEVAVQVDQAGFEAIVPFARWRPFGPDGHVSGKILDPSMLAAAIAARTSYSCIMSTIHTPVMHPIVVAKQIATLDHISSGRSALNIVCGWFKPEMEMFGAAQREHSDRYQHADEWTTILKRVFTEKESFDFPGESIQSIGAYSEPKPLQRPYPPLMNAGGSDRGRAFAAKHADLAFVMIASDDLDAIKKQISEYRDLAKREYGRDIQVWSYAFVAQGETDEAARQYFDYAIVENGDWVQVDEFVKYNVPSAQSLPPETLQDLRVRIAAGTGGIQLVGTAETIAERLAQLSDIGLDGLLLSWVDYKQGAADFSRDVLPLLEKRGLRSPFRPATGA